MIKYLMLLVLTACSTSGVAISTKSVGSSAHADVAYEQSCMIAYLDACPCPDCPCPDCPWKPGDEDERSSLDACDWPDNYPGIDEPGSAYKEGKAATEDADCIEDKEEQEALEEEQAEAEEKETWF